MAVLYKKLKEREYKFSKVIQIAFNTNMYGHLLNYHLNYIFFFFVNKLK